MIVDKACAERGCACYDDRVDGPGVEMVKKEWQGLKLEEILETYRGPDGSDYVDYARAIEAKLKEKNQ